MSNNLLTEGEVEAIVSAKKSNPSLSGRKIAEIVNRHQKTVNRVLNQHREELEAELASVGGPEYDPKEVAFAPTEVQKMDEELDGTWIQNDRYVYNGVTDAYVNMLKCRPKPLVIGGNKFRSMRKAYSDWDGNPSTINEICRRFAIPRDQFQELKTIHGWTHESEPFTREEIMAREVDDLADDAFQQRRQAVWEGFEKKRWHKTKMDAQKWNDLEQSFILPLQDHLSTLIPEYYPPMLNLKSPRNPFSVVTSAGELHYGGSGWVDETGEHFSRKEAEERLIYSRECLLEEVSDRGRPDSFFYAAGNDFFTIDNDLGGTTRGTPQELDGTAAQILSEGVDLTFRDIDMLRSVSPVRVLYVPGNHDRLLSLALLKCVQVKYQDDPNVTVEFSAKSRAYSVYGDTLLGFAHGDGALKPPQYMATMAKEAPAMWADTIYRAFFTGHLHHEVVRELVGGTHYQMSSLRGADRFHERNAYLADAALSSYIVDKHRGVCATIQTRI